MILEGRLYQAQVALTELGNLLHVNVRAGSVSAMKAPLRGRARPSKAGELQLALPFKESEDDDNPFQ